MIVGCYTLDLYCDFDHGYGEMPRQFTGRTEAECMRQAREAGWTIRKCEDRCRCKKHRWKHASSTTKETTDAE